MEGLKDIKGLMEIPDYSLYIFIAIILISLVILFLLVKMFFSRKKNISPIKIAKKELKNLDFGNSKMSAYILSKYGPTLKEEDFSYLEKYKYKKETMEFSKEDLEKIKRFLDELNV